jgi:transformer-2 protein
MAVVALVVILSASVVNVNAQMRHLSPEQIAEIRSERMARELHLSAAQYAKLYRLNLREARRMNHGGACFFDCEDYRCDLRQIIGIINYRLYESLVHNHRHNHHSGHLHAQVHHSHSAHVAPHAVHHQAHVAPHVAPHAKPHVEAHKAHVKPHAEPHAKPHAHHNNGGAGKHNVGKSYSENGGSHGRPQYRMK